MRTVKPYVTRIYVWHIINVPYLLQDCNFKLLYLSDNYRGRPQRPVINIFASFEQTSHENPQGKIAILQMSSIDYCWFVVHSNRKAKGPNLNCDILFGSNWMIKHRVNLDCITFFKRYFEQCYIQLNKSNISQNAEEEEGCLSPDGVHEYSIKRLLEMHSL